MALSVTVYCSSSNTVDARFLEQADDFGAELGRRGHRLVYGGATVGSMGRLSRACRAAGGYVVGVIPRAMIDVEIADHGCDELVITESLRDRKHEMDQRADAFVALPGGFGTLEELFEVLTAKQLGWHRRPIVLVDADGFWSPLLELCEHMFALRFAKRTFRDHFVVTDDIAVALDACSAGQDHPAESKWS